LPHGPGAWCSFEYGTTTGMWCFVSTVISVPYSSSNSRDHRCASPQSNIQAVWSSAVLLEFFFSSCQPCSPQSNIRTALSCSCPVRSSNEVVYGNIKEFFKILCVLHEFFKILWILKAPGTNRYLVRVVWILYAVFILHVMFSFMSNRGCQLFSKPSR